MCVAIWRVVGILRVSYRTILHLIRLQQRQLAFALALLLCVSVFAGPVLAEDDVPADEPVIVTEIPSPPSTDIPPSPTVVATESPTEAPIPTEVPATDVPPTEVQVTVTPDASPTMATTEVPTQTPTATSVPEPCEDAEVVRVLPLVRTQLSGYGSGASDGETYPTLSNVLTVTIMLPEESACLVPDWVVTLVAGPMTESGGGVIPASAISFAEISEIDTPGLSAASVTPGASLASSIVIARGTNVSLDANHLSLTFRVLIELSPPPGVPPGVYQGEIVVDVVSAP